MLRGEVLAVPKLSHHNHGVDYYLVPFRVPRLSGAEDVVNLVVSQPQAQLWQPGNWLEVGGEVRSYNNRSGQGSRLVITMLVREVLQAHCREGENHLLLAGALCKPPVARRTPLGREICDLLLAVTAAGGKPPLWPGGLLTLHRLGVGGKPLRPDGGGGPAAPGGTAPEPPIPQDGGGGATVPHRL